MLPKWQRCLVGFFPTKSENTKSFIESCNKPAFAGLLGINSEEDLIIFVKNHMDVLALKFAVKFRL